MRITEKGGTRPKVSINLPLGLAEMLFKSLPEDAKASLGAQVPHPARLGSPEEYAALARHIVENGYLNAEIIRLDGGIRMAPR